MTKLGAKYLIIGNCPEEPVTNWLKMNDPDDFAAAGWEITAGSSVTSTANGAQFNHNLTNWNKMAKATGITGTSDQAFEMVIFRTGTALRAMFGTADANVGITTWPGGNSYQRQYHGVWNFGASFNRSYGSQLGEGGSGWFQTHPATTPTPAGSYVMIRFNQAGKNGGLVEIFESDAACNEGAAITSFVSDKIVTPLDSAGDVTFSVSGFDAGLSDYYITALRVV